MGGARHLASAEVAAAVLAACRTEIQALKPGNVSVHAGGHGMTAGHFLESAEVIAPIIGRADLGVGERVRASVAATLDRVGCNTNLGIVLLTAPLAEAVLRPQQSADLRQRLEGVLLALTLEDAREVYEAIHRANPGGLGRSDTEDVAQEPGVTLLAAMRIAAAHDRIAWQYTHRYVDVFETGLPALRGALRRGWDGEWAAVACYLRFLAAFPDTHIRRKSGEAAAEAVRRQAETVETGFKACENSRTAVPMLLSFDEKLKGGGLNPGTSADLTVATLVACRFEDLLAGS